MCVACCCGVRRVHCSGVTLGESDTTTKLLPLHAEPSPASDGGAGLVEHRGGMDCRPIDPGDGSDVAAYMNKISHELSGEHTKTARRVENMTPEQLFGEFADTGNVAYLELWSEYEAATRGP